MRHSIYIIIGVILFSCSSPKARKPVSQSNSKSFIEASIKRNKALIKMEEELFETIIRKDTLHTYTTSPNGFWYYYNHKIEDVTVRPKSGDNVVFNYEIRDVKNNVIFTKEALGDRVSKDLSAGKTKKGDRTLHIDGEEFLTGMQEGLKLMKEGEKVTFLFPSNKVFGATGFRDKITPNQSLIIEVYLKKINKKGINNNNQNKVN